MAADQDISNMESDPPRQTVCSFIIKIWQEDSGGNKHAKWRGHIIHVPSQERRYLKSLQDITDFVSRYLHYMGAR